MAFDAFLKFKGIEGESQDSKHKGEIEIASFNWGVSQQGVSGGRGGGMGSGKAAFTDFSVVKAVDKASPALFKACATGQHVPEVIVTLRRAGGDQLDYLTYKFTDVMVTGYQAMGAPAGGGLPDENLSFNFSKVQIDYKMQNEKGQAAGSVSVAYDLKQSKAV
jgi:type VI secretion system secreted protein Hcp